MYHAGQIVYDLDAKKPVNCDSGSPAKRTTHFIRSSNKNDMNPDERYVISCPKTIKEAQDLMDKGLIMPSPIAATHCWKCMYWLSNHPTDTCKGYRE